MENLNETNNWKKWERQHKRGKILAGFLVVIIGVLLLAKQAGIVFPEWFFSWPMLLIAIGFITGVKHSFKNPTWFILMAIGGLFLADRILLDFSMRPFFWPIVIIAIGLGIIFSSGKRRYKDRWRKKWEERYPYYDTIDPATSENEIDSVVIFGSIKKNIISKNYKGGEVTCIFGGAEINLSQADIQGEVVLETTQIFGGTKLIVPANWQIKSEIVAILGGIEDKRPASKDINSDNSKVLVLKGTAIFGGVEIKSF